jgi:hypothetical protein
MEPSGRNQWQPAANARAPKSVLTSQTVATGCDQLPVGAHGEEGVDVALCSRPSAIHSRRGKRDPAHIPLRLPTRATTSSRADPAGGSRKLPQVPANPRNGSAGKPCTRRKSPPIPRSGRKRHDRPVTPEVAGSSPVAPVKYLQIGMFSRQSGPVRPPASRHPALIPHRKWRVSAA